MRLDDFASMLIVMLRNDPTLAAREVYAQTESPDGEKNYALLTKEHYLSDELFWNEKLQHNEKRPAITFTGEDC